MQTTRSLGTTVDRMFTLNRAIDNVLTGGWLNEARVWIPAVDLIEKRDAFVLHVELPGVSQSDVDLVLEQNVLTVRGTKHPSLDSGQTDEVRLFAMERPTGTFERSVRLPESVERAQITAELVAGVLTVTIPKAKAAQPQRIEIGATARSLGNGEIASHQN